MNLRQRAEKFLLVNEKSVELTATREALSLDETRLLHELLVSQIELEMQNEELQLALAEMREHKERLGNIVKYTPAGYFCIDPDGRFIEVNGAWLQMFGYDSPEEVIGKHFNIIQVDSNLEKARIHLARLLSGEAIPSGEFFSRRKDGSVGYHTFSAHPVVHADKVVRLEWFIIDISEHKRLEDEKAVLEQQFQQAQKLESLGILAGGIAHDFNNILAIILGHCGLMEINDEEAHSHVPAIKKAVERAALLCRQMLDYAGMSQHIQTQVNLVELVDEMLNMLKATLPQNVVIKQKLSAKTPFILGDGSQIRQIVMNLIINASEAISNIPGEIAVSLAKPAVIAGQSEKDHLGNIIPPGKYFCLEVKDNGCGMDEATKCRIFEPFFTTKFTGRGLGMSAVLGIITAHKGAVQLFSQPGEGTTFKVYLPVQTGESAGEESPNQTAVSLTWQGSGTILLVEDEEQIRMIGKILLKKFGFAVLEATNGKEALELYQKYASDIILVVTDMGMPVMDGYALIRALKKISPELPIIISSGFGSNVVTSQLDAEDIAGLLSKPYNPVQMLEVLKSVVEGAAPP
jgi:PAS domain S-box-containing protein